MGYPTHSDGHVVSQEDRIRILEVSNRMLTDQVAELVVEMREIRALSDQRLGAMEAALNAATETTAEVRDILQVAKAGLKVLGGIGTAVRWLGYLSTAALAMWAAFTAVKTGAPK